MSDLHEPFSTLWVFVTQKKEPYHSILMHVYSELVKGNIYVVNSEEIYEELRRQGKLLIEGKNREIKIGTIRRTLYAVIYGRRLKRDVDFRVTSSKRGKNLKIMNTSFARSAFRSLI